MLITIHNSKLEKVAFIDNDKQDTLNFYNDKFSQYLTTASATFEFTVYKKGIKSDTIKEKAYQTLTERSFISFKYNGRTYLFNVITTEENDTEIRCYCENLNLELLNEYAKPYKSNNQLSFIEYCNLFSILKNGAITIGVNEVADYRRTLEWTGQDTNLKRLLSIANNFDAEIEFVTHLKNDSSLKSFVMNIYRKNDGKNQGVGKRRDDIKLEYGKNISGIKRRIDKKDIFNATKLTGRATVTTTTTTVKQGANKLGTVSWSGGNLNYAGHNISSDVVGQILALCTQHKLLPSGVFSQLYLESWWGASNVARVDNNWGGLTWTGNGNRPSGVVVTQGSARPANEGGYYMHFASVSDYMKDYTYLLAEQGIYKVKGADSIDVYTKGLFRVGGATYDYATAGYAHYAPLMRDIRSGINRNNNNAMDNLDNQYRSIGTVGTAPVSQIASKTKSVLDALTAKKGQLIGSGQCYALSAWYAQSIGGPGLGGGVTSLRGLIGAGMAASQIGTDYNWEQFGWKVVVPNKVADLIPGSIANIKANFNGGFLNTTGWGHTVVIKAISGDTLTVLEQNFAGHQYVEERTYSASAYLGAIQSLCYPPEIVQGKRIDGTTQVPPEQQNTETSTSTQEKILEIRPDLYREYKNGAGQVEFYVKNGAVYAPLSKDLYPSAFSGIETDDNWIRKDFEIQADAEEVLIQEAIKLLKKNAYPEITYEVDGYSTDLAIGDTVKIYDKSFSPKLILEARVTEQHTSFTNPSQNKSVFDNFKALESKISSMLTDRMNEMVEESKPYDLRLITDNGTSFKNGEGVSNLTAEVWRNNKKFDATYQFKLGDKLLSAGLELTVKAIDLTPNEPLIITVDAYIGNDYVASKQVTFINVNDGVNGSNGRGITSTEDYYLVSASKTGITSITTGWVKGTPQVATATNKYHWHYHVDIYSDGTRKETVPAVIGIYGDQGVPGTPGADGKTPYWHTAWANSADGKTDFSLTDPKDKQFRGEYIDYIQADSTDPTKYNWIDRTSNVKVGGVNLLKGTSNEWKDVSVSQYAGFIKTLTPTDLPNLKVGDFLTFSFDVNTSSSKKLRARLSFSGANKHYFSNDYVMAGTGRVSVTGQIPAGWTDLILYVDANLTATTITTITTEQYKRAKLELGNVATDYLEAHEDTQIKIDSKADQALTQEQLIAIAEEQRLMKASLEASASLEEFQSKSKELLDRIQAIADGQKVSEQVLVDNASRIVQLAGQIGAVNLVTEAITKYMSFSDDGLIIGMKDGSSSVRVANDRISFYSAGKETAFISQGFLQIESGIFTLRLQIASFLFEESASGQLLIKKIR